MTAVVSPHWRLRGFQRRATPMYRIATTIKHTLGFDLGPSATARASSADNVHRPLWLNEVYSLSARNESDAAIDILFPKIDALFRAGEFAVADDVLRAVDVARLNTSLMVAVLAITRAAKDKLPHREVLLQRIERRLTRAEPVRVERLLRRVR